MISFKTNKTSFSIGVKMQSRGFKPERTPLQIQFRHSDQMELFKLHSDTQNIKCWPKSIIGLSKPLKI